MICLPIKGIFQWGGGWGGGGLRCAHSHIFEKGNHYPYFRGIKLSYKYYTSIQNIMRKKVFISVYDTVPFRFVYRTADILRSFAAKIAQRYIYQLFGTLM